MKHPHADALQVHACRTNAHDGPRSTYIGMLHVEHADVRVGALRAQQLGLWVADDAAGVLWWGAVGGVGELSVSVESLQTVKWRSKRTPLCAAGIVVQAT